MQEGSYTVAGEREFGSGNFQYKGKTKEFENDDALWEYLYNTLHTCALYWNARAKSGDDFSVQSANTMNALDEKRGGAGLENGITAMRVGQIAYLIWKAMNHQLNKIETNVNDASNTVEEDFKVGSQIKLDLTVKEIINGQNSFGYTHDILCSSDENPGIHFKVSVGTKISKLTLGDFSGLHAKYEGAEFKSLYENLIEGDVITIVGKVKSSSKKYKSVGINYAEITDVKFNNEARDAEEQTKDNEQKAKNAAKLKELLPIIIKGAFNGDEVADAMKAVGKDSWNLMFKLLLGDNISEEDEKTMQEHTDITIPENAKIVKATLMKYI